MNLKTKLTKTAVEALPVKEKTYIVWDASVSGLHLKVYPNGRRVYFLYYRNAAGRQRRPKIGRHGDITLEQARKAAAIMQGDIANSKDPSAIRKAARRRCTLAEFWPAYLKHASARTNSDRTAEWRSATWKNHLQPRLGVLQIDAINLHEITSLHDSLRKTPVAANHAIRLIRAVINVAIKKGVTNQANPAANFDAWYPEKPRDVFLNPAQVRALLIAIDEEQKLLGKRSVPRTGTSTGRGGRGLKEEQPRGISSSCAALFRLLLFTGARRNEIQTARWSYYDRAAAVLRLPKSKTGKKVIYLNELAIAEVERLRGERTQTDWIIEGHRKGERLISPYRSWQRVRARAAAKAKNRDDATILNSLRLHDLRHSFASAAVNAGISLAIVGKTLGHATEQTTRRYAHIMQDPVKRAADTVGRAISDMMMINEEGDEPPTSSQES